MSLLFAKGQKIDSKKEGRPLSLRQRLFSEGITKSWWVILFLLICALVYEPHFLHLKESEALLQKKLLELKSDKEIALQLQEELQLKINSQDDHDWIEMTLMRKLGLVPEGQVKILFKKQAS